MRSFAFRVALFTLAIAIPTVSSAPVAAQADDHRFALGIGAGLVEPESQDVETYVTASLRIRVGRALANDDDLDWAEADEPYEDEYARRERESQQEDFIRGYVEPEIAYWELNSEAGNTGGPASDLLIGVNLIAVIPFREVEVFLGVGLGAHFNDSNLPDVAATKVQETSLGANAQFGLDLNVTNRLAFFGVGRFDLVERTSDRVESKVYLGLRFKF